MSYKLRFQAGMRYIYFPVVFLAGLTYNNWILGPWLNHNLFAHNGSVSEFSVSSQPHYLVFRLLDILSGVLLLAAAAIFKDRLGHKKDGQLILIITVILGLANIIDAIFGLPCSETLNNACSIPISLSPVHFQVPAHAYSSIVIGLCYFGLPACGLIYGLARKTGFLVAISIGAVAESLFSFISAIITYGHQGLNVRTAGDGQEIQMIVLAVWLVAFYLSRGPKTAIVNTKDEP